MKNKLILTIFVMFLLGVSMVSLANAQTTLIKDTEWAKICMNIEIVDEADFNKGITCIGEYYEISSETEKAYLVHKLTKTDLTGLKTVFEVYDSTGNIIVSSETAPFTKNHANWHDYFEISLISFSEGQYTAKTYFYSGEEPAEKDYLYEIDFVYSEVEEKEVIITSTTIIISAILLIILIIVIIIIRKYKQKSQLETTS